MFRNRGPFVKGLIGGTIGTCAVALVLGLLYVGWTLYWDHQNLQAIIRMIQQQQQQQQPRPPSPEPKPAPAPPPKS